MSSHCVYILHFDRPYWKTCQHYIGYTKDLDSRIARHRAGNGSKLVKYAINRGINFRLVRVEYFDTQGEARTRETRIKRNGGAGRICPLCRGDII